MKKKEPTIAEILHYAADYCLHHDYYQYLANDWPCIKQKYSCDAIAEAVDRLNASKDTLDVIFDGLENLGLARATFNAFDNADEFNEVQQQRYSWLKFCALLAEEQGE